MSTAPIPIRAIPDYASVIESALLNTPPNTRRAYRYGMVEYLHWLGPDPFTARSLKRWADVLLEENSAATVNLRLSAVRRLAEYAAEAGLLPEVEAGKVARVKGLKSRGVRTGNWLTFEQAQAVLNAIDRSTLTGKRDAAIYALLFGCGLREDEAARLEVEQLQQREDRWLIADLEGKHNRVRTVPVSSWAFALVNDWLSVSGVTTGRVLRAIGHSGAVSAEPLSTQGVYRRAAAMGRRIGIKLASHDFRRTFGRLAVEAGADPKQIQLVYGHADERTTRRYLNLELDLKRAPGDVIEIRLEK